MWKIAALLIVLPAALAVDCTGRANGIYEKGCRAFVVCTNHVAKVVECTDNKVFDESSKTCVDPNSINTLCSQSKDCSLKQDGRYADTTDSCATYYTCNGGTYFGHNFCPGKTVFNEAQQSCDWVIDTDPPCGTKGLPHRSM